MDDETRRIMAKKDRALDAAADAIMTLADLVSDLNPGIDLDLVRANARTIYVSLEREPDGMPMYWSILLPHQP